MELSLCWTCTELSVLCTCSFLPQALWGWGWLNVTSQLRCGFGSNTFPFTWQGQVLQALRVQLLLPAFSPAGSAPLESEMVPFGCPQRAGPGLVRAGEERQQRERERESLTLPSHAFFRRRPHLLPGQAQGNSTQAGQTPLGAVKGLGGWWC